MVRCNICGAPWHPVTGHFVSERMVWCGPCTRAWVKELCGMQNRRWGGERFYDHATVPPKSLEQGYVFHINSFSQNGSSRHSYLSLTLESSGISVEDAYSKIAEKIPLGCRVWMWNERQEST